MALFQISCIVMASIAVIVIVAGEPLPLTSFMLREGPTAHSLSSDPIIVKDDRTFEITNLHYDGTGPDAFFMVGVGEPPAERPLKTPGHRIPNEKGSCDVLKAYNGDTVKLVLPTNFTVHNIEWLAIYCIKFKHTFGYVVIPKDLKVSEGPTDNLPQPCDDSGVLGSDGSDYGIETGGNHASSRSGDSPTSAAVRSEKTLTAFMLNEGNTAHDLRSGSIVVKDIRRFVIPNLYYDGKGPDAFFMVGTGNPPAERPSKAPGHKIPNEKGNCNVLTKYNGQTITLTLPSNFTVHNIDWLAMYCIYYKHTFGFVVIPKNIEVPEGKDDNLPQPCKGFRTEFPELLIFTGVVFAFLNIYIK